jgi:hypothetical protein
MKLTFEIVAIWTLLNFVVGIPVWMLVKTRDRREMAHGLDYEGSYMSESNSVLPNAHLQSPGPRNPTLPLVVAAGRLVPDAGPAVMGAVSRTGMDSHSVLDV